jgi:hypothetical protein
LKFILEVEFNETGRRALQRFGGLIAAQPIARPYALFFRQPLANRCVLGYF